MPFEEVAMVAKGEAKKNLKVLRKRWDEYIYYLGQLAYRALRSGAIKDEEMEAAFRTILEIERLIEYWEGVLSAPPSVSPAGGMARCTGCGSILAPGSSVCKVCGAHAGGGLTTGTVASPAEVPSTPSPPSPVSPASPAASTCPSCSTALEPDARFCPRCGSPVSQAAGSGAVPEGTAAGTVAGPHPAPEAPAGPPSTQEVPGAVAPSTGEVPAAGQPEERGAPVMPEGGAEAPTTSTPVTCPSCGGGIEEPDARFCPRCGAPLG